MVYYPTCNISHSLLFYSGMRKLLQLKRVIWLWCFLIGIDHILMAQVYNYYPLTQSDQETNPTVLNSERYRSHAQVIHLNSFDTQEAFSYSSIRVSGSTQTHIWGFGITASHTSIEKKSYEHYAFSVAYRNVLFNKILIKTGLSYKMINTHTPVNYLDNYTTTADSSAGKPWQDNINIAFTLTNSLERYYLSFGILNINTPWNNNTTYNFPQYYCIHAGNLMSFFDKDRGKEVSYDLVFQKSISDQRFHKIHYVNLKYLLKITRKNTLQIGLRTGYSVGRYIHLMPSITAYSDSRFSFSFAYQNYLSFKKGNYNYIPNYLFSINYKL